MQMIKLLAIGLALLLTHVSTNARGAILPRLIAGEDLKICAIGTSLTTHTTGMGLDPNWFEQTGAWLQGDYPGQVTLSNRAVAGAASKMVNGIKGGDGQLTDVLTYDNPDAIFIEFAINDALTGLNISVNESKSNLQTMINRINTWSGNNHKPVDIIVSTMNNASGQYGIDRFYLENYYQGYCDVAASNRLLLIDNYPNWKNLYTTNEPLWHTYVPDTIHPASAGATAIIMPQVKASLRSQVPEPGTFILLALAGVGLVGAWLKRRSEK
jgi:lysophospholipase L1-like esterase